jgi:hypothetical protein
VATIHKFPAFDAGLAGDSKVIPFRRPLGDSRAYDIAVEEQRRAVRAARADLDHAYAEHLQRQTDDELRAERYARWQRRVTVLCIGVFYLVLFIASFQIGRAY